MKTSSSVSILLGLLLAGLLMGGCSKDAPVSTVGSEPVYSRQQRQGAATLILSLSETNITSSGKIHLMLDVHAPPDAVVTFPEIGNVIDPFSVANDYTDPLRLLPNGKELHRRVWELVPGLPGDITFPAMEIQVDSSTLKTAPVQVAVTSVLPENLDTLEIKDIAAPVELLPEQKKKQQRGVILLAIAGALIATSLLIKRVRRRKQIVILPPHETAFRALDRLPEDELARIFSLSEILLSFIEGRFALITTGKTIPEILPSLPKEILLGRRAKLEEFLTTGEQIRFSNKVPSGFAEAFERYVRSFVDTMKEGSCD